MLSEITLSRLQRSRWGFVFAGNEVSASLCRLIQRGARDEYDAVLERGERMPPKRDPRRDQAAEIYKQYNGQIDLAVIAEQLGISAGTVRGWKSKDKTAWSIGTERGSERSEKRSERSKPILPSTSKASSVDKLIADAVEENEELTEQQKDFCTYYSRIRNATQAYFKAYGCAYSTAHTNGPALLANTRIKEELRRLREIKTAALGELCGDDVVELHMRIAFADINDFIEFKSYVKPVMRRGAPVVFKNPETGVTEELTQTVNVVKLRSSETVDGQLITEVSEGRDGVKIKRTDQQRSLAFLERYFELNPMDKHRKEYDARKLEIDLIKVQAALPPLDDETGSPKSNFSEALKEAAIEVWDDDSE